MIPAQREKPTTEVHAYSRAVFYATFVVCAFNSAHLARCAVAILFLPAAEIVRVGFAVTA